MSGITRTTTVSENMGSCPRYHGCPHIKSISICGADGIAAEYCDGGLIWNNPVKVVIEEGEKAFGSKRRVACIVSIGTGHPPAIGLANADWLQALLPRNAIDLLKDLAMDCETKARECENLYGNQLGLYYRFNVEHGLEKVSAADWKMLGAVKEHTKTYMENPSVGRKIDQLVDILRSRNAIITTAQLSKFKSSDYTVDRN
jgi:hypothetical protein